MPSGGHGVRSEADPGRDPLTDTRSRDDYPAGDQGDPLDRGSRQNPWASMRNAWLNLLRKFSNATCAVSSTISAAEKCSRSDANSPSLVSWPEIVIPSAKARTFRSSGVKCGLVAYSERCANFSSAIPAACPEAVLMSTQNGHPFREATRTYTRYFRAAGISGAALIALPQAL
jgi:hypothetical protein